MKERSLRFSDRKEKVPAMAKRLRNRIIVAGLASATLFGCGDTDSNPAPPSFAGTGSAAGAAGTISASGGTSNTGGSTAGTGGSVQAGAGGEEQSLCEMYPAGHDNRHTFSPGDGEGPGCSDYVMLFTEITSSGLVNFQYLNMANPTGAERVGFRIGDQRTKDFPGVGVTTFELCSSTSEACLWEVGGDITGDANCSVTLAATRSFPCE